MKIEVGHKYKVFISYKTFRGAVQNWNTLHIIAIEGNNEGNNDDAGVFFKYWNGIAWHYDTRIVLFFRRLHEGTYPIIDEGISKEILESSQHFIL